jgi:hypothetical protein
MACGKCNCPCSVEGFWLNGVIQGNTCTHAFGECLKKWLWLKPERKYNIGDAGCSQMGDEML